MECPMCGGKTDAYRQFCEGCKEYNRMLEDEWERERLIYLANDHAQSKLNQSKLYEEVEVFINERIV